MIVVINLYFSFFDKYYIIKTTLLKSFITSLVKSFCFYNCHILAEMYDNILMEVYYEWKI